MKKKSIIILHGWGLSGEKFNPLVKVLSRAGYDVFAPDLPGFGSSQVPDRIYELSDYAEFVRAYIKKHSISQPIILGHSFGGRIALKLSHVYPSIASALILTGTPGYTPVPGTRLKLFILGAKFGKLITSLWPISLVKDWIRSRYYYAVGARDYYRANSTMREIFKRIVTESLVAPMKCVSVPCLLVWGEQDTITPLWIARKMSEVIPNATLEIIEGAAHNVPYVHPDKFSTRVLAFIRTI